MADDVSTPDPWDESEETADERGRRLAEIMDRHAVQLTEHFDAVQIIVVKHNRDDGSSQASFLGHGDWYSRYGAAVEMLRKMRKQMN